MTAKTNKTKKAAPHTETTVEWLPNCDMCHTAQAHYDSRTAFGWANLCTGCFRTFGAGLGLGKGQKLILKKKEAK